MPRTARLARTGFLPAHRGSDVAPPWMSISRRVGKTHILHTLEPENLEQRFRLGGHANLYEDAAPQDRGFGEASENMFSYIQFEGKLHLV